MLWTLVHSGRMKTILHVRRVPSFPTFSSDSVSAESFSDFFLDKIKNLRSGIPLSCSRDFDVRANVAFSDFPLVTRDEMLHVLSHFKPKTCAIDPLPSWIIVALRQDFADFLCKIVNVSLSTGEIPASEMRADVIIPLLKKPGLEK